MPNRNLFSFITLTRKRLTSLRWMYGCIGVKGVIHVLVLRFINHFVVAQNYKCLLLDPRGVQHVQIEHKPGLTFREVKPDELDSYTSNEVYELTDKFLAQVKSREGDMCYGAFSGGTLVGYGFYASRSTDVDKFLRFHFPAGMCYVYKVFTHPDWRGQRLCPVILFEAMHSLCERGVGTLGFVVLIQSHNYSSLKTFKRFGFREHRNFRVLGIAKWRIVLGTCRGHARDYVMARMARNH